MTNQDAGRPIVVAVDGSGSARRATRWAAAEAVRRGRVLLIVHAYEWPVPYGPSFVVPETMYETVRDAATKIVRDAHADAEEAAPGLRCETEIVRGTAIPALLKISEQAAMLVLGSRGLGGFTGLLAGSVTVALAAHGHCPVAVIREEPPSDGPV